MGVISSFLQQRREKKAETLRTRAYEIVERTCVDYPYFCGDEQLAAALGIRQSKVPYIMKPYIESGKISVKQIAGCMTFKPANKSPQPSA